MSKRFLLEFLDFIIPRFCLICDTSLNYNTIFICNKCESEIHILDNSQIAEEYNRQFKNNDLIDAYTSLYVFEENGNLQKLIHELKYEKKFKVGMFLGQKLAVMRKNTILSWNADLIISVPLFSLKKIERNYNQAYYIAKGVGRNLNIPIKDNVVKRKKNTISQTTLTISEREENVHGAFSVANKTKIKGKRIILVDDVITTGATVKEIAKILKNNGAERVFALSVANPPVLHSIRSTDS